MALRLAYRMLTHVLSGLALLAESDAAKEAEILLLRHRSGTRAGGRGTGPPTGAHAPR